MGEMLACMEDLPVHVSGAPDLVIEGVMQQVNAALAHNLDLLYVRGLIWLAGCAEVPAAPWGWPHRPGSAAACPGAEWG